MKTVLDDSDININDVTVFEFLVAGYPVTNNVVNRGTDRFREALVVQGRRYGLLFIDDIIMANIVQIAGRDAWFDMSFYHLQNLCCQLSCNTHFFNVFGRFYGDRHTNCVF